ncbi:hypothetical protein [Shinella zoogloeoides]|nr:hypothetical protein [Shinella zoogloeoides]
MFYGLDPVVLARAQFVFHFISPGSSISLAGGLAAPERQAGQGRSRP